MGASPSSKRVPQALLNFEVSGFEKASSLYVFDEFHPVIR